MKKPFTPHANSSLTLGAKPAKPTTPCRRQTADPLEAAYNHRCHPEQRGTKPIFGQ
jgi:hypothetical protein